MQPWAGSPSVNDLVDQQVRRWMAEQERRRQEVMSAEPPRPVITLSREAGAGGTEVARATATRLGFELWDQELVQRVAEQSGATEALLRAVDEHARNAIEDLIAGVLMGDKSTETEYFAQLTRVIHAVAQHGRAVIVGRGAQFALAPDRALRVRVVGPRDERVRMLASDQRIDEDKALAEVERVDRERLGFIRHHYHRDAADPTVYDLVINTAGLTQAGAVDVVVAAYAAKFPRP